MIVVTAPTSRIGGRLLSALLPHDEPLRVIARDPGRLPAAVRDRAEVVAGSHRDPAVVDGAFEGADAVFWLVPADPVAPSVYEAYVGFSIPAAAAIVRHGVQRVVSVSSVGRGVQRHAGHVSGSLAMDDLLRSTGAHFRALENATFMDNVLRQRQSIRDGGVLAGMLPGDLALPTVATRDIAAVASRLLLDRTWTGQDGLALLGPEDLSGHDMAGILTDVLGTPIRYVRSDRAQVRDLFVARGHSPAMAQSMIDMDVAAEQGLTTAPAPRTPDNPSTPTTFRQWATEELKPALAAA
jgi:uncharacterized protein YbjT (DUF2867 family)